MPFGVIRTVSGYNSTNQATIAARPSGRACRALQGALPNAMRGTAQGAKHGSALSTTINKDQNETRG